MLDLSGQQRAFQENLGGLATTLTFDAPAAGIYYVGVSSNGDFSYSVNASNSGSGGLTVGSYVLTLTLSSILVTEKARGNDSLATAQPLGGSTVLQGTYVEGATQYYRFTASGTGGLSVSVVPTDATAFLPQIALLGASGHC